VTAAKVIVVAKRSAWSRHVEDEHDPRARSLLRKKDQSVANWRSAHQEHRSTLALVKSTLEQLGARVLLLERPEAVFDCSDAELVVTVGGDGTLLAASHNIRRVPILGVNSSRSHSIGYFCAAHRDNLASMLPGALAGKLRESWLNRMQVTVNGRVVSRRVLNEALFCHASPAATSRYIIGVAEVSEEQRSSGLWIGPAAGSTGAQFSAGGRILPLASAELQLVVREPYIPAGRHYELVRCQIPEGEQLTVKSKMDDAVLFLDGPHQSSSVSLGDVCRFSASKEPLCVLGLSRRARPRRAVSVR
jgi:NAD+ kinase